MFGVGVGIGSRRFGGQDLRVWGLACSRRGSLDHPPVDYYFRFFLLGLTILGKGCWV